MKIPSFGRYAIVLLAGLFVSGCSRESKLRRSMERAEAYFKAANYEAARIEYQNVLQLDPKHTVALQQLGRIWLDRGAPLRALHFVQQLRAQNPDDRDAQLKSVQIALAKGKLEDVRRGAGSLLANNPNHPEAIVMLTEFVRGEADMKFAEQALEKFSDRERAAFHLATANLALHRGDMAGAKSALERAVRVEPNSAEAHSALGAFYLASRDTVAANEQFKAASDLSPLRSNARVRYLEVKAQTGAQSEAVDALKSLTKEAPDFFTAWRCLAQVVATASRYDEALGYLENIFALDSWNYDSRVLRAQILTSKGDAPKAISELEKLSERYPDLAGAQFELGRTYLSSKDAAKAKAALKKAITINPDHDSATLLWAGLSLRSGEAQPVVAAMSELLAKRPGLEPAQKFLFDALGALGRFDDIIAIIRESLRVSPNRAQGHHLLGLVLSRQGKRAEARQGFERALELAPHSLPSAAELVNLDLLEGKIAPAKQRVQELLEKSPATGGLHLLAARVHAAENLWEETEASAWKAIELGVATSDSHDLITRSYLARKDMAPRERIEGLLAKRPNDPSATIVAGAVYMQLKDYAKAAEAYEKCLSLRPNVIVALNNLSYLYSAHLDKQGQALEFATKARELEPNSPEVADTLGWILFNRGEYQRALELLTESVGRLPANAEVQFHFARANQMLGRVDPARAAFKKAAESAADFDGKAQIKDYLAQLEKAGATP